MKTIIAGSRGITDYLTVLKAIEQSEFPVTEIVSGSARGVDALGERFATEEKLPLYIFPADWNRYGKRAGYIRNELMAENADALIAVWDGKSRGTKNMIDIAGNKGLKVFVYRVK